LALPRGGGNPRFRAFAGLDDGTLGQAGVYKPTEIIATLCGIHLQRPLSQKSDFCIVWMKRNFSLLLFQDDSSRGWITVARAAMQDGRGYTNYVAVQVTSRPSLPSWAACRICPLLCSFSRAEWDSPSTLAGVLYWVCQNNPLSGPSGATYRRRTQNCLPLNLT
jgi:hypothetical protein